MTGEIFFFNIALLFILVITGEGRDNLIQCQDETGNPVDWFVMYKIPKITESQNLMIRQGVAYLYMSNQTVDDGWKLSKEDISSKSSMPGKTLNVLYNDDAAKKNAWIIYNDQPPNTNSYISKKGHSKGVVIADEKQGLWMIHSVPNFPAQPRTGTESKKKNPSKNDDTDNNDKRKDETVKEDVPIGEYSYPKSGEIYGQSFLCISINSNEINSIANQLIFNQIISYKYNIPNSLRDKFSRLVDVTTNPKIEKPPYNNTMKFQSTGGENFLSFAKTDKWRKDLYDDFVAPQLQIDMLAETWLNGRGRLPSDCRGSQVLNIQSVILNIANVDFKSSRDHSKWTVAMSNVTNKNWICIGDINRADTQFNRGGGTVCINSMIVWKNYRNLVNEVEPCPTGFFESIKNWFLEKMGRKK